MKEIVLKACFMCGKCKVCIMTTICQFEGVVSVASDAEKGTVTIVGDVDATCVVRALRRKKKPAVIVSVRQVKTKSSDDIRNAAVDNSSRPHNPPPCPLPCCRSYDWGLPPPSMVVIYDERTECCIL